VNEPDDPTELSPASDTETRSDRAWGLAEDAEDFPTQRLTPSRITAVAVAASVVVIAVAAVVAFVQLRGGSPAAPTSESAAASPAPTTTATPAPRTDLLNGVYQLEYHWGEATYRDSSTGKSVDWHPPEDGGPPFDWIMMSSTCTTLKCIATGEMLDWERKRVPGARTIAMELKNGSWAEITPPTIKSPCTYYNGDTWAESTATVVTEFAARPDGTFAGTVTTTVDTDECGDRGSTVVTPLTVARVGDAD
jgi:hypothetical protein